MTEAATMQASHGLEELKDTTLSAQSALAQLSIGGRVDFESQLAMKIEDSRFLESVHNRLEGLTVAARQDGGEMGDIVECTGLQQISDTFPELAYTVSPDSVSGLPSTFTSQTSPSPKNTLETGDVFEDGHPPTYLDYIKGLVASSIAESSESLDARTKYCPASLGNLNRSFVAETGCDFGVDVSQEQTSAVFGTDLVSIGLAEGNSNSLSAAQYVGYRVRAKAEDFAVDGGLEEEEDTGAETKPTQGNVLVSRASLNLGADSASTGGDESNPEPYQLIQVFDAKGIPRTIMAQLDTAADISFISRSQVKTLGLMDTINFEDKGDHMVMVNNGTFQPLGSIELRWKVLKSMRCHTVKLFMVDESPYEIVFGKKYIKEKDLVIYNWGVVAVIVKHSKSATSDVDRMAKMKQAEGKAALEEKKQVNARQLAKQQPAATSQHSNQIVSFGKEIGSHYNDREVSRAGRGNFLHENRN